MAISYTYQYTDYTQDPSQELNPIDGLPVDGSWPRSIPVVKTVTTTGTPDVEIPLYLKNYHQDFHLVSQTSDDPTLTDLVSAPAQQNLAAVVASQHPNAVAHDGQETPAQTAIRQATGVDSREPPIKPLPAPDVVIEPVISHLVPGPVETVQQAITPKPSLALPAAAIAAAWFLL
jgi:hypothetical protein